MTTGNENLDLCVEGNTWCTRFRFKQNTTSVYLNLQSAKIPDGDLFVKIIGRKNDTDDFVNYTYKTESFPIKPGKKYFLYNLSPENSHIRLEFEGPHAGDLQGVWSPDSLNESGCITIGPEYKSAKNAMNTKDESFSFTLTDTDHEYFTNFRDKYSNSSIYLNLTNCRSFSSNNSPLIECRVYGKKTTLNNDEVSNCTYKSSCYFLEPGKKYELFNNVNEEGFQQAAISFLSPNCRNASINGVWSPDYKAESGVIQLGGSTKGNTSDTNFSFNISSNNKQRTEARIKSTFSSVYLKINSISAPVRVRIIGIGGPLCEKNETNKADFYLIENSCKYELFNTVKENEHQAVQIEFESFNGKNVSVSGSWSPDYIKDPQCIVLGSSSSSSIGSKSTILAVSNPIKLINVPYISQQGIPTGCESVSSVMVLQYYKIDIQPYDFISRYLPKMPVESRPDPNCVFVGNPYSSHAYGCFSPCITTALKNVLKDKNNFIVNNTTGRSLQTLCSQFIDHSVPVIVWATMSMIPTKIGSSSWRIKYVNNDAKYKVGDLFKWPGNEHCLVLVGYNNENYIVNDPLAGIGCYPKSLFEQRFVEQGSQSVVVSLTDGINKGEFPKQFVAPSIPLNEKQSENNETILMKRISKGISGGLKAAFGIMDIASACAIVAATDGIASSIGWGAACFGASKLQEGIFDIINAVADKDENLDNKSLNPIRDFLFNGNDDIYNAVDLAVIIGVGSINSCLKRIQKPVAIFTQKNLTKTGLKSASEAELVNTSGGSVVCWDMPKEGQKIYGRFYHRHPLERMAPKTNEVVAELENRFLEMHPKPVNDSLALKEWNAMKKRYVDPRGIPPMVVEDIIQNEVRMPNYEKGVLTPDKFKYVRKIENRLSIGVIVNKLGEVVTVFWGK